MDRDVDFVDNVEKFWIKNYLLLTHREQVLKQGICEKESKFYVNNEKSCMRKTPSHSSVDNVDNYFLSAHFR